ncbi:cold-shock protein [Edwardsiella tarda]|uniref:cold-shock protein n=1 Tax=Edwardsiella tarda TaxID=636 RepID=UPI003F65A9FB
MSPRDGRKDILFTYMPYRERVSKHLLTAKKVKIAIMVGNRGPIASNVTLCDK